MRRWERGARDLCQLCAPAILGSSPWRAHKLSFCSRVNSVTALEGVPASMVGRSQRHKLAGNSESASLSPECHALFNSLGLHLRVMTDHDVYKKQLHACYESRNDLRGWCLRHAA